MSDLVAGVLAANAAERIATLEADNAMMRAALKRIAASDFPGSALAHRMAAVELAEQTLLALSTQGTDKGNAS